MKDLFLIISNLNRRRGLSVSDELSNIDNILKYKKAIQFSYVLFRVPKTMTTACKCIDGTIQKYLISRV